MESMYTKMETNADIIVPRAGAQGYSPDPFSMCFRHQLTLALSSDCRREQTTPLFCCPSYFLLMLSSQTRQGLEGRRGWWEGRDWRVWVNQMRTIAKSNMYQKRLLLLITSYIHKIVYEKLVRLRVDKRRTQYLEKNNLFMVIPVNSEFESQFFSFQHRRIQTQQ